MSVIGSISELVARYVASQGLAPSSLYHFKQLNTIGADNLEKGDQHQMQMGEDEKAVAKITPLEKFQCEKEIHQ